MPATAPLAVRPCLTGPLALAVVGRRAVVGRMPHISALRNHHQIAGGRRAASARALLALGPDAEKVKKIWTV